MRDKRQFSHSMMMGPDLRRSQEVMLLLPEPKSCVMQRMCGFKT